MEDSDMELDTVKAILSVMLMNYGGCCSINNLKFDYRKYLGGNSEKFSVTAFRQLVSKCDDIFRVYQNNGDVFVELRAELDLPQAYLDDIQLRIHASCQPKVQPKEAVNEKKKFVETIFDTAMDTAQSLNVSDGELVLNMSKKLKGTPIIYKLDVHNRPYRKEVEASVEWIPASKYQSFFQPLDRPLSPSSIASSDFRDNKCFGNSTPVESDSEIDEIVNATKRSNSTSHESVVNVTQMLNRLAASTQERTFTPDDWIVKFMTGQPCVKAEVLTNPFDFVDMLHSTDFSTTFTQSKLEKDEQDASSCSSEDIGKSVGIKFKKQENLQVQKLTKEPFDNPLIQDDQENLQANLLSEEVKFTSQSSSTTITSNTTPKDFIRSLPIDHDIFLMNYSEVIREPCEKLHEQPMLASPVQIYISEVYSPVHFWFNNTSQLDKLEKQLQHDYGDLSKRALVINDSNMKVGLLVACYLKLSGKWHRAIVIEPVKQNDAVRLHFIDYGTVGTIDKQFIKYLFKSYLNHPRLSYRGRCLNLKPPKGDLSWDEEKVQKFLKIFSNQWLYAKILEFDEQDDSYTLDINLVCKMGVVNMRKWLLKNHLAEKFKMNDDSIYPLCYHFPSFDQLESNYPTFDEQLLMQARQINYYSLLETNFFSRLSNKEIETSLTLLKTLEKKEFKGVKEYYCGPGQ